MKISVESQETNPNLKTPSPPDSLLLGLHFAPNFSAFSPEWCREMGKRGCSQFITHYLCCSFLFICLLISSLGFLLWKTVFHKLLPHGSFHGVSQSGTDCCSMGSFLPESMGLARSLLHCKLPVRPQPALGIHLL